jgi:hypothetical protein
MHCSKVRGLFETSSASASSETGGLAPAHRGGLNSTYFFTHRRSAAIRDRRSSTYSWAIARNPEMTWLVRRSLMQTISSWERMTCPLIGTLTNRLGCDAWLAEVEPLRGAGRATFDCNREKRASLRRCHKFFQCFYRIFFICLIPEFLRFLHENAALSR